MASCPKADVRQDTESLGFHFTPTNSLKNSTSHFSTLQTMKDWIDKVYVPYTNSIIQKCGLKPADQKSILLLDAYPVHIGVEFWTWVQTLHLNIFLLYVPANCTGQFQPADVGLQQIIKHHIKQESLKYHVAEYTRLIEGGITPDQVTINHKLPPLQDSTVSMMTSVYWILKLNSVIVRKAWTKCVAKDINLGLDLLNNQFTITGQLIKYLDKHPELRDEISAKINLNPSQLKEKPNVTITNKEEVIEDSEVLLTVIINRSLGLDIVVESNQGIEIAGDTSTITVQDGHLTAGENPTEDILYGTVYGELNTSLFFQNMIIKNTF